MGLDTFDSYPESFDGLVAAEITHSNGLSQICDQDVVINTSTGIPTIYKGILIGSGLSVRQISAEFQDSYQDEVLRLKISDMKDLDNSSRFSGNLEGGANQVNSANKNVRLFVIERGLSRDNGILCFKGKIDRTSAFTVNPESVEISVISELRSYSKRIGRVYTREDYPDMEDGSVGKMIPFVFGDYENDLDGAHVVPATWIGTKKLKICDHRIASVASAIIVRRSGRWQPINFTVDDDNGEITLVSGLKREKDDKVFVRCKGYPIARDQTDVSESPAQLSQTIIRDVMGMSSDAFANFDELDEDTNHLKCRRIIDSEIQTVDLLQSLAREVSAQVSIRFDMKSNQDVKIYIIPFNPEFGRWQSHVDPLKSYRDFDIGDFDEALDPSRIYQNVIDWGSAEANKDTDKLSGTVSDSNEEIRVGREKIDYQFLWITRPAYMHATMTRELYRRVIKIKP